MILKPNSYMDWAHNLHIGLGLYCGFILGLGLGSLWPTMNPYGSLVVKQAEKLKGVNLHGELVRRVIGECGFEVEGLFSRAECM